MTTRLACRSLLLTAGMTLLLAACSGGSTPAAAPGSGTAVPSTKPAGSGTTTVGTVDPCSLLTQTEVDAAVGQPLGPGKQVLPGDCQWTTSNVAAGVDVTVADWAAVKTAATAGGNGTAITVPGIGDEALYLGRDLYVRKGEAGFELGIFGPHIDATPDGGLGQAKVLAALILPRL
jgi:hypothetical protein